MNIFSSLSFTQKAATQSGLFAFDASAREIAGKVRKHN